MIAQYATHLTYKNGGGGGGGGGGVDKETCPFRLSVPLLYR